MAQLMPLPLTISCSSKSRLVFGFTFLVPAHPGSPGQSTVGRKMVVVVVVLVIVILTLSSRARDVLLSILYHSL